MAQLGRLRKVIAGVPSGKPRQIVPGYIWAEMASRTADEVEALADALDGKISDYASELPHDMYAANWMVRTITNLTKTGADRGRDWGWEWHSDAHLLYMQRVANDTALSRMVDDYLWKLELLSACRDAFLEADRIWRSRSWDIERPDPVGYRPRLVERLTRPFRDRRELRRARREAEQAAGAIVVAAHSDH